MPGASLLQAATSWTREGSKNDFLYNEGNQLNASTGWYDMFFRNYDPVTGRMMQVDPYATSYASHSVYNYAMNNPVMMNDPSGGQATPGNYSYSNAAEDRINKIGDMNNPEYFSNWSESFKTPGMILYDDAEAVRTGAMSITAYASKYGANPAVLADLAEMLYDVLPWAGNNPDANLYTQGAGE